MQNAVLHKAKDLKPGTRAAIEEEFGRVLQDDEEVSITAYSPHDEPDETIRRAAAARLRDHFERFDERNTATTDEAEAALLEALRDAKPGYRERD